MLDIWNPEDLYYSIYIYYVNVKHVRGIEFAPFYDFWNCSNSYDIFVLLSIVLQEEFEDTKGVIRIRKPKTDNYIKLQHTDHFIFCVALFSFCFVLCQNNLTRDPKL
jgi:hypothetical protein